MTLFEELETAIVEVDPEQRIRQMNRAAEQCFGGRRERLLGAVIGRIDNLPPDLAEALGATVADHRPRHLSECRFAGGVYDCEVHQLDNGHLLLELNDRKWGQQTQQIQQRDMQTGLLDLMRRNLGHEIRNPLGGIRGAAQMMAAELGEGELGTLAELIMREVDRIDELIQGFWQPVSEHSPVDIHHLVAEAQQLVEAEAGATARLLVDYDPSIPPVPGDAESLRRLFLNLARNACQAGASQVLFRTRIEHGSALLQPGHNTAVRVDVEDDGEGVPESLQPLLFMPMVTGRREGTGLGLALAQQIAGAHGGLVTFEPLARGSRFTVRLPVQRLSETTGD